MLVFTSAFVEHSTFRLAFWSIKSLWTASMSGDMNLSLIQGLVEHTGGEEAAEMTEWKNINHPAHPFGKLRALLIGQVCLTYLTTLRTSS